MTLCVCVFFFIFFSIMVYHRILNMVPCATQGSTLFLNRGGRDLNLVSERQTTTTGTEGAGGVGSPGSLAQLDMTPPGSR